MKYDVFISCKSDDYNIGRQVYEFLVNHRDVHLHVFMADKELRKQGNADYGNIIDEALDSSSDLIIVSSNAEYLKKETSSYVYEEWHTFVEEIRSGRKKGNIMTIFTDDVDLKDVPIALRNRQSFPFTEFSGIIDYLSKKKEIDNSTSNEGSARLQPLSLDDDIDVDLDYDDALDFMQDGDLQEAIHSLIASFENGNGKTIPVFNKLLFQNFGTVDWDKETWIFFDNQVNSGYSFASLAYFYKYQLDKHSHSKAMEYIKQALADKENGYAYLCEGVAREKGIGIRPNLRSAMKRYEQAYKMGIAEASSYMAEMYLNGNSGLDINSGRAIEILEDGCKNNDARSFYLLAKIYTPDIPIEGGFDKAIDLYHRAISLKMYEAWIALGKLYENYLNLDDRCDKALHCYFEAIKNGVKDGHAYAARLYWKQERFEEAKREAEIGDKNNNVLSISALGNFYEEGIPDVDALMIEHKPDYQKAWHYYQKAFDIGGRITDAISIARLYVKKEYRPSEMTWETIQSYLEEGIKVPIPQAIELMVDALKENGREDEAVSFIKIGAENGSLPMMYEFGIRSLSTNTGEGLKLLEESGIKGYKPSILKLLEYYQLKQERMEYERWLDIAYSHQVDVPICDYSYYLFRTNRDSLWSFLKNRIDSEKNESLYWMAFYLWRGMSIPSEEITWLLDELNQNLESIVTYKTKIYDIYADLLLLYSNDANYRNLVSLVSEKGQFRSDYLILKQRLYQIPDNKESVSIYKEAKHFADNLEIPNEWRARFRSLMHRSLTARMRILIIGRLSVRLSDFCNLLKVEMYEHLVVSCESLNREAINEFNPHIVVNCCETTNLPAELNEILVKYDNSRIVHINLNENYKTGSYSTYESWSCSEDRIINILRRKLIITKRNEFGIPSPDFRQFGVLSCEDEDSNFMMLKIILGNKVNLMRARDGVEAIAICEEASPDLILMDIRLPNMDGLDAARIINEVSGSRISIVALSAYAFDENIREALQAGMEEFLPKPFKPNDLVDTVTTVLEKNYILKWLSEK